MTVLEKGLPYPSPMEVIGILGMGGTVLGCHDISEGKFWQGVQKTFLGLTATNLGARSIGFDHFSTQELMKDSILIGASSVTIKGATNFILGGIQKNKDQMIKGLAQGILGATGYAINNLDAKVILVAHQATLLAFTSLYISKSGLDDLSQGNYKKGICKIFLGVAGLACASYYVYNEILLSYRETESFYPTSLNFEQNAFLSKHKSEIEQIYTKNIYNRTEIGNWKKVGEGATKYTYEHPDLSNNIVKFPNCWCSDRKNNNDICIQMDYKYLRKAQKIILGQKFPHIKVPAATLVKTSKGLTLFEQKFDLIDFNSIPDGPSKKAALTELTSFMGQSGLCDVPLSLVRNAGFLKGTEKDPTIGVYDFDCNIRKNAKKQLITFGLKALADGVMILKGGTRITKVMTGKKLATAIMIVGSVAGVVLGTRIAQDPFLNQIEAVQLVGSTAANIGLFQLVLATTNVVIKNGLIVLRNLPKAYLYLKQKK